MNPKTLGIICLIGTGLIYAVGSAIIRPISAEFAVFQQLIFLLLLLL